MSKSINFKPLGVGKRAALTTFLMAALVSAPTTDVYAKGGTAKPPTKGAVAPYIVPTLPDPGFGAGVAATLHQFDVTGFIQDATSSACAAGSNPGGTITVNGITITVPSNVIVQFPANTMPWCQAMAVDGVHPSLTLVGNTPYGAIEARVVGNIVGGEYRAALIFLSQQSANSGSGVITSIDYGALATGSFMHVLTPSGSDARIQINDPNGRYGFAKTPDDRFSVDDQNPTIHAATGYPMCVPRGDPANDGECPAINRPLAASGCRNFSVAGVAPPVSGELSPPAAGQVYCSQFVMKAATTQAASAVPLGLPGIAYPVPVRTATEPDATKQVPFEVGDFVTYSGTLIHAPGGLPAADYISAHTIEANVGVYTQPYTQPSYLAIGEFGVGTADPALTAVNGAAQETQDRIFLEAGTTDVKAPVDIFMVDTTDTATNTVLAGMSNRWVTPYEMTGECNPATGLAANCFGFSGGITTQNAGPQPQRARIRATKAVAGLLSQPSRNVRVMVRTFCGLKPAPVGSTRPYDQAALDACVDTATPVANGLIAGQYLAPTFEFIFPEGVKPGDPVVPNDLWHLPFVRFGEGSTAPGGGAGPLVPTPW